MSALEFYYFDISSYESQYSEKHITDFLNNIYEDNDYNFKNLGIKKENFFSFVNVLRENYLGNSYHNFNHAVDATVSMCFLIDSLKDNITSLEKFSLVISMLCHDVGHFGFTGQYVKSHLNDFTKKYGLPSPLESYHESEAKKIIIKTSLLDGMNDENKAEFFKILSRVILATDPVIPENFFETFNKSKLFELMAKCADIGNALKIHEVHEKWVMLLMREFYNQGNFTKHAHSGNVHPLFDETMKHEIPRQQVGFCNFYVEPHFRTLAPFLKNESELMERIQKNKDEWASKIIQRVIHKDPMNPK